MITPAHHRAARELRKSAGNRAETLLVALPIHAGVHRHGRDRHAACACCQLVSTVHPPTSGRGSLHGDSPPLRFAPLQFRETQQRSETKSHCLWSQIGHLSWTANCSTNGQSGAVAGGAHVVHVDPALLLLPNACIAAGGDDTIPPAGACWRRTSRKYRTD